MSIDIGTVTINRNPNYETDFWKMRMNHFYRKTADGSHVAYDNGPNILQGIIVINNVAKAEGDALLTWLLGTAVYGKNSFTISPPTNTDLGEGAGSDIDDAYYDGGNSSQGMLDLISPGMYIVRFPYWKKL